jgi:hypothetical protein
MSASSDDVILTPLQRAAMFADKVRHIQSRTGKKFTGGNYLSAESQYAITKAATESAIVAELSKAGEGRAVLDLFERFEEMCRRRNLKIEPEIRVALVDVLAGELLANQSALGGSATKLIRVTVLQGAILPDLKGEFERFREMSWVFLTAAVSYPSDPRAFLRKVANTIDALSTETEFERFRETPGVIAQAAVNHPADSRTFLRRVSGVIDMLTTEPEFEHLRETPWIFTRAAVSYPSDPRGFLRKVASIADTLAREPEFERFRETPFVIARAAVSYRADPRAFLRKVGSTVDTLATEPEFARFRETPRLIVKAVVIYPSDPRAFLRKAAGTAAPLNSSGPDTGGDFEI